MKHFTFFFLMGLRMIESQLEIWKYGCLDSFSVQLIIVDFFAFSERDFDMVMKHPRFESFHNQNFKNCNFREHIHK